MGCFHSIHSVPPGSFWQLVFLRSMWKESKTSRGKNKTGKLNWWKIHSLSFPQVMLFLKSVEKVSRGWFIVRYWSSTWAGAHRLWELDHTCSCLSLVSLMLLWFCWECRPPNTGRQDVGLTAEKKRKETWQPQIELSISSSKPQLAPQSLEIIANAHHCSWCKKHF